LAAVPDMKGDAIRNREWLRQTAGSGVSWKQGGLVNS
jgi:hypothetical protein